MENMLSFAKKWSYVKFCQKYGGVWSFAKYIELCFSFAKKDAIKI
jgi:hypothetical protein